MDKCWTSGVINHKLVAYSCQRISSGLVRKKTLKKCDQNIHLIRFRILRMKACFDFIMTQPLVFLFQLIFGQWAALWESCWREKSSFLAPTVSFTSVARDLFFPPPRSRHQASITALKCPCGCRALVHLHYNPRAFFSEGEVHLHTEEKWAVKGDGDKGAELSGLSCSVSKCGEWTGFDLLIRVWRRDWKRAVDSFWLSQSPMQQHNKMR